jgi:hypothetical protein
MAFIRNRLGRFFNDFPSAFPMLPFEVESSSRGASTMTSVSADDNVVAVVVVVVGWEGSPNAEAERGRGTLDGRSNESLLTMLVPCVLGDSGIFPVVALVTCDAQSPAEYGTELLPSVVSLHRCFPGGIDFVSPKLSSLYRWALKGSPSAKSATTSNDDTAPFISL